MKFDTWYCAGWSQELRNGPIGRTLFGRPIVLFRDASGTARALGARCPHRGANLASGSVVEGAIECPLHGWRFDGLGRCVRVPSQPASVKISPLACVPSFPLQERQGTLWIWMSGAEPPSCEPHADPVVRPGRSPRRLFFDAQIVEAPFLNLLENFFDKAHVPFIHRATFGPNQDPLVTRQRVTLDADRRELHAEDDPASPWHAKPRVPGGLLGGIGRLVLGLKEPSAQQTRLSLGGAAQVYVEYPNGTYDLFITRMTPVDEARTWLFVESVRTRAPHIIGDWIQRRVIRKIFDEGQRESSLILSPGPDDQTRPISVESDRVGLAARELYERRARTAVTPATELTAIAVS